MADPDPRMREEMTSKNSQNAMENAHQCAAHMAPSPERDQVFATICAIDALRYEVQTLILALDRLFSKDGV